MKLIFVLVSLAATLLPLFGELPNEAYLRMQKEASEEIELKVDGVKHQHLFRKQEEVTATVTKVVRSVTKLKVGDKIIVKYRHIPLRGAVGPSPIPKLRKGGAYPAWLKKNPEGFYEPAARGRSFSRVVVK